MERFSSPKYEELQTQIFKTPTTDYAKPKSSLSNLQVMERWQQKNLYIFFLPKYSPDLNKAKTFWRKAKYERLKLTGYASFAKYQREIKEIFNGIGLLYKCRLQRAKR